MPAIKTASKVVPMIYAYTTPGVIYNEGYIKIGYTEHDVDKRIKQQTHTVGVNPKKEWQGNAIYDDGTGDSFRDTDFHAYLRRLGVKQKPDERNEWFQISPTDSHNHFIRFRVNRGKIDDVREIVPYVLREEQADAVRMTLDYRKAHERGEFLWNAKPRFGKTLSVYDLMMKMKAEHVLIVTNRPAIANSWYEDYEKFIGRKSGYFFVSNVDGIKGRPLVMSYKDYENDSKSRAKSHSAVKMGLIEFVSLQDLKGSMYFGGEHEKLREVKNIEWDMLVIDEAHEGVDTFKTDLAFDRIKRRFTLHLSGTPFKALANEKFPAYAIYNWTYADEQRSKRDWDGEGENPYETLPKLNLFTYKMSEIIRDKLSEGIDINGETEDFAFDLGEFFRVKGSKFEHEPEIDKFLDELTSNEKFPFSTPELRNELKHTLWLLNRVEAAKLLAKKLERHPVFRDYKIIIAAGNDDENIRAYNRVTEAIKNHDRTITLSVGQLTTGITIPEWSGVLMLANIKSPALYVQAAFRAQNPCLYHDEKELYRKENAYVFDFDPARTLIIYEQFANNTGTGKTNGAENVRELLNFFPVIGEDENGEMIELDAEKVLSIPRKIMSKEVVNHGFMSDFLFENVSRVFNAPPEIRGIIAKLTPVTSNQVINLDYKPAFPIDDEGNINVGDEYVIGLTPEVFGEKVYGKIDAIALGNVEAVKKEAQEVIAGVIQTAKEHYGQELKPSTEKQIKRELKAKADRELDKSAGDYEIQRNTIEQERREELANALFNGKTEQEINNEYDEKQEEAAKNFQDELRNTIDEFEEEAKNFTVKEIETNIAESEKSEAEFTVKDYLRGFSRAIPAFLMAYGDENTTLETFDKIIPDEVFREVTSISLDEFRMLRDEGQVFAPVVFNDSIKEFMRLREELANYFDENSTRDIFDFIPPQRTNQIFTPKSTVIEMVNMLEQENPGCFDDPDKTFIDPYMKSGLFIAEIVKRLYRSANMKKLYPDKTERLKHIFEKQVYGLAPSEIIYRITKNFILGFDKNMAITRHNLRQINALAYIKEGKLSQELFNII